MVMKKYNVVFALSYEIEAEDQNEARKQAEALFKEELSDRNRREGRTSIFLGCNIEDEEEEV